MKGFPATVEGHDQHFAKDTRDDQWFATIGDQGWIAIGQDYSHHTFAVEIDAIKTHRVGIFYLWGANATEWEQLRVLAKAWDRIEEASRSPRPFIYRIRKSGLLESILSEPQPA